MIGQVAAAHGTKCIKEDGRDSLHQLYYGTGPATMPSGMLPRSPASRRGRSQEGSCCPERTPRLLTSTAGENGGRQTADGDKTRTATRRLVLHRELLKDAIYMATKAVDKYSRRERRTADGGQRQEGSCCAESYSRMPSTWLPRLSTSTAGENGGRQTADGERQTRTATRRLVLRRELLKDAKRAGHR